MSPKRILVIEDETDIREMLSLRLKKEKFDILEASEGIRHLQRESGNLGDLDNCSCVVLRK